MTVRNQAQERMSQSVRDWILKIQEYPGWKEWKRAQLGYTLRFDEEFRALEALPEDFEFSPELETEYAIITRYLEIISTANALRDVEWYFRRYPFSRAPVSRESHLRYCCEMYFGRFYQFRERLKNLSKAVKKANPDHGLDFGRFIKTFDKEFDQEIRERHGVHHHEAFDEVTISRIALLELMVGTGESDLHRHYRKTAREWAARARRRSQKLDEYVEAVATGLLEVCPFLVASETP